MAEFFPAGVVLESPPQDSVSTDPAPHLAHKQNLSVDLLIREVYLTGELEEDTGDWFVLVMRELERRCSVSSVRVMLSTPGGSVDAMFSIHDAIRHTPCPVEVLAYGQVCSAGVLLLACGDRRLVTENLVLMAHESRYGEDTEGLGFRASRDRRRFEDWQHYRWAELMGRYTPQEAGWWRRKMERQAEFWLLGGQAIVDEGLADGVAMAWPTGPPDMTVKRHFPVGESSPETGSLNGG